MKFVADATNNFTIYAAFLSFTLFGHKIHYVAIYVLLCGAKHLVRGARFTNIMYGTASGITN